jgi:hypothetical protein
VGEKLGWLRMMWAMLDERLAELSLKLQRIVRLIRTVVVLLWVGVALVLLAPVVLFVWPEYFPIAYALSTVVLVIPIVALAVLAGLPLKARSVVRLIDKGYPANAKEIAIRLAARKLHDQSIETEELLVDTAINEGRKILRRVQEREAGTDAPDGTPASP